MKDIEKDPLPKCDFCGADAEYDAPTKAGPWAFMCKQHFTMYAGFDAESVGYHLIKRTYKVVVTPEKMKAVMVPLTEDSVAEVKCPYCGTYRSVEPDANYIVSCEGCGHKYRVYSMF